MNEIIRDSLGMLLDVSLKSLLLAILAGAGLLVFRVRSSTVRHRVWMIVLLGMIAMPLLVPIVPGLRLPIWLRLRSPAPVAAPPQANDTPPISAPLPPSPTFAEPAPRLPQHPYPQITYSKPATAIPVIATPVDRTASPAEATPATAPWPRSRNGTGRLRSRPFT